MPSLALKRCERCGRELSPAALYCPGCGARQAPPAPAPGREGKPAPFGGLVEASPPPMRALASVGSAPVLSWLDDWIARRLEMPSRIRITQPTLLCETGEEFYGSLFESEPLSPAQMQALLEAQLAAARADAAAGGGIWGVYLAHKGCLINGWLFKEIYRLSSPRAAMEAPGAREAMAAVAAHEKWGHGLLSEATPLGRETHSLLAARWRHAKAFPFQRVCTPEGLLLRERWEAVFSATRFAEEGWASWVEDLLAREALRAGPRLPADGEIIKAAAKACGSAGRRATEVLLTDAKDAGSVADAMAWWEMNESEADAAFRQAFGRSPRYIVGYAICRRIERRAGARAVLAALMIAGNIRLSIDQLSVSDLRQVVLNERQMNMNRRLALLAHLPFSGQPGVREFAELAFQHFGFAKPEIYGWAKRADAPIRPAASNWRRENDFARVVGAREGWKSEGPGCHLVQRSVR